MTKVLLQLFLLWGLIALFSSIVQADDTWIGRIDYNPPPVPSIKECRKLGVEVPYGSEVTGTIDETISLFEGKALVACGRSNLLGCAREQEPHHWIIYYTEEAFTNRLHEACHAYYEIPRHTRVYVQKRNNPWRK